METTLLEDLWEFCRVLVRYFKNKLLLLGSYFETFKSWLAFRLYWQRGRLVRPFVHSGMAFLVIGGITLGPTLIAETFPGLRKDPWQEVLPPSAVSASVSAQMETATLESIKPRFEATEYLVQAGDTVSTIAERFGISVDTIRWENKLKSIKDIKPNQVLRILPTTGIFHKVKHGETIFSIAKKYDIDPQGIVDWPYNVFTNDETFALDVGQMLIIPEGVMPKEVPIVPRPPFAAVPGAGLGAGQLVWPASGRISQGFTWYHQGIDIANKEGPNVVAAADGVVAEAGWPTKGGYGIRVILDHGNGVSTLYGHFAQIYVSSGQRVSKGQALGKMGSTGRSTGTHVHFEVRVNGAAQNPMSYLK